MQLPTVNRQVFPRLREPKRTSAWALRLVRNFVAARMAYKTCRPCALTVVQV